MSRPAGPPRQSDEEISFYLLSLSSPPSLSLSSLCLLPFSLSLSLHDGRASEAAVVTPPSSQIRRRGVAVGRARSIRPRRRAARSGSATGGAAGSPVGAFRDGFGIARARHCRQGAHGGSSIGGQRAVVVSVTAWTPEAGGFCLFMIFVIFVSVCDCAGFLFVMNKK